MLYLLFACAGGVGAAGWSQPTSPTLDAPVDSTDDRPAADARAPLEQEWSADSGDAAAEVLPTFDTQVDVIVIGSGPAGMAAAISAREAGASVILFERDDRAGEGVTLASRAFAVGTAQQAAAGVVDTVETALAEWEEVTGVSGEMPGVVDFVTHSAETLVWLEEHGAALLPAVSLDPDGGTLARVHMLEWPEGDGGDTLLARFDGELRLGVEVTAPVLHDGALVGVAWRDVASGAEGYTGAAAVVVATGGFLRDTSLVATYAPDLAARDHLYETNLQSDGGGLPFLDAVGAGSLSPEAIGVYVHAIQDPEKPDGEALVAMGADNGIYVGESGERFADESLSRSFDIYDLLPEGEVYAVIPASRTDSVTFMRPYYNWSNPPEEEILSFAEVAAMSGAEVWTAPSLTELASLVGIEPTGLSTTIEEWNDTVETGGVDAYGRSFEEDEVLDDVEWVALRLLPGLAKNFGGVSTDVTAHVLDRSGAPIPGLYAAGEVAGMIVGGGGGDGFSGSVTACYRGGLVAGEQASAYALAP